ncbi:MAG: lipid-A-disaccharide synthase, partial [Alphaproteobacteria bacterium]|nr:lipid-A-disaccharide synthase [Alphaproteobacteria bacterium]
IHYVAPSVWAYKPERAAKVAELFDHILVLFPFEKQYFTEAGISNSFVGHSIIEQPAEPGDGVAFREKYGIPPERKLLLMLPGSRRGELARHLPLFKQTAVKLQEHFPGLECLLVTIPATHALVQEEVRSWPVKTMVIGDARERRNAYAAADAALVKSGTATLEIALAGVPMVVTYKVNPVSAWIIARMIRTRYICLVNIMAKKEIVPELLQSKATPDRLSWELVSLMAPGGANAQLSAAKEALSQLRPPGGETPSRMAAKVIWQRLGRRRAARAA